MVFLLALVDRRQMRNRACRTLPRDSRHLITIVPGGIFSSFFLLLQPLHSLPISLSPPPPPRPTSFSSTFLRLYISYYFIVSFRKQQTKKPKIKETKEQQHARTYAHTPKKKEEKKKQNKQQPHNQHTHTHKSIYRTIAVSRNIVTQRIL